MVVLVVLAFLVVFLLLSVEREGTQEQQGSVVLDPTTMTTALTGDDAA